MSDWYMAPLRVKVGRTNWSSLKGILKLRLLYHYQRVSGESGCLSAGVDGVLAADLMSVLPFTGGAIIEKITVDQSSVFHWKWGDDAQPFGSLPHSRFVLFYTHVPIWQSCIYVLWKTCTRWANQSGLHWQCLWARISWSTSVFVGRTGCFPLRALVWWQ